MNHEDLEMQLRTILVEYFDIKPDQIHKDAALYAELGLDSIDAVDIMQQVTDHTGLRLTPEQFRNVTTVGDFTATLASLSAE